MDDGGNVWLQIFVAVASTAIVAAVTHAIWAHNQIRTMRQTLYGEDGGNGLKSDVKKVREKMHDHANMLTEHEGEIEMLKQANHRRGR
jgi:hypothetical protein